MNSASQPQRKSVLGPDGEIKDLDTLLNESDVEEDTGSQHESVYCTRCGTGNPYDASYCARCGRALIDPGSMDASQLKRKRDHLQDNATEPAIEPTVVRAAGQRTGVAGAFSQLVTMAMVAGMAITSLIPFHFGESNSGWVWAPLLAWFLVEAVRGGKQRHIGVAQAFVQIATVTIVTGIVITAFALNSAMPGALLTLLAWFLIEAVRS